MVAANNTKNISKMNRLKSLGFVLLLLIIILVLVVVRSSNKNLFKQDSKSAIESAQKNSNSISNTQLKKLTTDYLVVVLENPDNFNSTQFKNSINIPFENILEKENRKILRETTAEIILFSEEISTASKAWVILNQLGFNTILILQPEENDDVFKYKFQPDTRAKLE